MKPPGASSPSHMTKSARDKPVSSQHIQTKRRSHSVKFLNLKKRKSKLGIAIHGFSTKL